MTAVSNSLVLPKNPRVELSSGKHFAFQFQFDLNSFEFHYLIILLLSLYSICVIRRGCFFFFFLIVYSQRLICGRLRGFEETKIIIIIKRNDY